MNNADYELRLRELQKELTERLGRVERHIKREGGALSSDFEEQAVERQNDEVVFALDDSISDELRAIDAALSRIESGDFGVCTKCGSQIELARLDAIPFAATCISCKELA